MVPTVLMAHKDRQVQRVRQARLVHKDRRVQQGLQGLRLHTSGQARRYGFKTQIALGGLILTSLVQQVPLALKAHRVTLVHRVPQAQRGRQVRKVQRALRVPQALHQNTLGVVPAYALKIRMALGVVTLI